jgi:hypothetical protein
MKGEKRTNFFPKATKIFKQEKTLRLLWVGKTRIFIVIIPGNLSLGKSCNMRLSCLMYWRQKIGQHSKLVQEEMFLSKHNTAWNSI